MYFRITIPSLQDGKKDEAISFVKEKVMPEFDDTPGLTNNDGSYYRRDFWYKYVCLRK